MNETAITIIGILLLTGAMAKSSQIPLHSWLPGSMEGFKILNFIFSLFFIYYNYISLGYCFCYIYYDISYHIQSLSILPILNCITSPTLQTITGNMLGDGSISLSKNNKGKGKYAMDVYSLNYLNKNIYSQMTSTKIYAYPNILLSQHHPKG